jgi:hypothetical protein
MSLQKLMPWLVGLLVASALAMRWSTFHDARGISAGAALLFVAAVVAAGFLINRQALRDPGREGRAQFHMLRRNTRLTALVYAWGAAAMLAVYALGALKWRHGWQYATAMALVAALLLWLVDRMGRPGNSLDTIESFRRVVPIAALHGALVTAGLAFLLLSGKLATVKGDWAANHVFLAGGIGVVLLSVLTSITHQRLAAAG